MAMPPNTTQFSIHVVGDKTGETYKADFVTTKIPSHRQRLLQSELMRQYLGPTSPQHADEYARERAEIFATINSMLVGAPQFWKEKGNGLDLLDDNVISEVWTGVMKAQVDAVEAAKKKAEAATDRVKHAVEKGIDEQAKAEEE